jgi:hypothetical protein
MEEGPMADNGLGVEGAPRRPGEKTAKQVAAREAARSLELRVKMLLQDDATALTRLNKYYIVAKMAAKAKREVITPEELKARVARIQGKAREWGCRDEAVKKVLNVLFGL